jgi:lambda family phage portal protein
MNFIDKLLVPFAPKLVAQRLRSQMAVKLLDKEVRKFEGAGRGRRFPDNNQFGVSQNSQIVMALPLLKERSRHLNQNNSYAKNATRKIANNVIGTGIVATPVSSSKNKEEEKKVKQAWKDWAESTECNFDGNSNLYGIQKLIMKTVVKSGSCLIRRIWVRKNKKGTTIPLKLQVLDPDFLDHSRNNMLMDNGEYIVSGIQFSKEGQKIAYWLYDKHPNEFQAVSRPVPAEDISCVFEVDDPGQIIGIPWFSAVIIRMQDFDEYEDAQLIKQKIAACFSVFIQSPDGGALGVGNSDDTDLTEKIEPGIIQRGRPGETFAFASPPTTDGFGEFSRQSLQGQAAGIGLSYEALTGDLSNVNFSSGRMGWIEFRNNIEDWQWNMFIPMFCDVAWKWFKEAAFLVGKIQDPAMSVTWTAPRREMIDPVKETLALIKQIRAGLISWQDAVRQLGYSPEEILEQMRVDKENFDAAGVMPESDPRYDADRMNKDVQNEHEKADDK